MLKQLRLIGASSLIFISTSLNASITITSPNGGENLAAGSSDVITWIDSLSQPIQIISIFFSSDNGATWISYSSNITTFLSYANWTIPNVSSTRCLVKIISGSYTDISDATFTINNSTGIKDEGMKNNFLVYPIPSNDNINISNTVDNKIPDNVKIYDVTGKYISGYSFEPSKENNFVSIPVKDISVGTYILLLYVEDKILYRKIQVE